MRYFLISLLLTGCETLSPKPIVTEVKIPVRVKCLGEVPQKPNLITDAELIQLDPAKFVTELHKDRIQRDIYMTLLESAIAGCF